MATFSPYSLFVDWTQDIRLCSYLDDKLVIHDKHNANAYAYFVVNMMQ